MKKYCFKSIATFCSAASIGFFAASVFCFSVVAASAQTPAVMRKLAARYDRVDVFSEGRAVVTSNNKEGYVDTLGKPLTQIDYARARDFRNGCAVVAKGERNDLKYALIDRNGRELIPFAWDQMGNVNDGVAVAMKRTPDRDIYELIDTQGNVHPITYDYCGDFWHGYAVVGAGKYSEIEADPLTGRKSREFSGKFGYMTPDGTLAIALQFDDADNFDSQGMAAVGQQAKYYVKWGLIDRTGKLLMPYTYYSLSGFSNDLAIAGRVVDGGKIAYGYIDRTGKEVIACQYDMATAFEFANTWVGVDHPDGQTYYRLIDATGEPVLRFFVLNLQDSGRYGQATAAIIDANGVLKYGILSNNGKIILPFEYDQITIFSEWDSEQSRWNEQAIATKNGTDYSLDISMRE